jgi:ParB-like nuclease domain
MDRKVGAFMFSELATGTDGDSELNHSAVRLVAICDLKDGPLVRLSGIDRNHVRLLAQITTPLPPILVAAGTFEILDGSHRVSAAKERGETSIRARVISGNEWELYLAAVHANVAHGKPLTLSERKRAAGRLVTAQPELSDRFIAEACGLSHTTVGVVRRATGQSGQLTVRRGRDGRVRSIPSERARTPSTDEPGSPSLAHRDQRTLVRGSAPTPIDRGRTGGHPASGIRTGVLHSVTPITLHVDEALWSVPTMADFMQWFAQCQIDNLDFDFEQLAAQIPISRIYELSDAARRRAAFWENLAVTIENQARKRR